MPRIKEVKPDAFNGPQDISEDERFTITRYPDSDLARAVEEDHYCQDYTTCDIAVALEAGFPMVAASFLSSATECAHVDAVCWAHRFNKTIDMDPRGDMFKLDDWEGWQRYFEEHARMCESCGGANFDLRPGDECYHCNSKLLYQAGEEVEFWLSAFDPSVPSERDRIIVGTVQPADRNDKGLVKSGAKFDPMIDPDFWVHVVTRQFSNHYEIRASYLEDPIVTLGED